MRRFSFIHVAAPNIPEDPEARLALLREYAGVWNLEPDRDTLQGLGEVWRATNSGAEERKIGPAILRDMMADVMGTSGDSKATTRAVTNYVFPQLEGVPERKQIVSQLATSGHVDSEYLWDMAGDVLRVSPE
jgi:hypothetical protein